MNQHLDNFFKEIQNAIGQQNCRWSDSSVAQISENTLAFSKMALGIVFPRQTADLKEILKICTLYRIAVHVISQGKNVGYGEMTPAQDHQLVINLSSLNRISEYDAVNGTITVGPGVTQQQLSEFLVEAGGRFWADMTGASPHASIVGNTIEAGFGHTPLGDHRKHILGMDCILSNGQEINCSEMPAPGPDLAQLFIQTNFVIVTALKIPLLKAPEVALTYTISFDSDAQLFSGFDSLRELKVAGIIESLVHIGNSTRSFMTSFKFPKEMNKDQTLSETDCRMIMKKRLGLDTGAWTAVGCLYGFKAEVREKAAHLQRAIKSSGRIRFLTDQKVNFISKVLNWKIFDQSQRFQYLRQSFSTLKAIHGIMRGIPSAIPSKNILWRLDSHEHCGLIWHSPVVLNSTADIQKLIENHRKLFNKFGFEMPITLTMVSAQRMIAVFNINFDRSSIHDTQRAHRFYRELTRCLEENGQQSYRYSLLGQPIHGLNSVKSRILLDLKRVFDPSNLLAPGRFGLDLKNLVPIKDDGIGVNHLNGEKI